MEQITSINNEYIKYLNSLHNKKTRYEAKEYLIEGYHLVEEADKANLLKVVLGITKEDLTKYPNARQILVTKQIIDKLSTTMNPQPIIGLVDLKLKTLQNKTTYILLDNINDPGNLGTIIRTSLALGVKDIILTNDTVDPFNEKVIRATQGTIFKCNIYVEDLTKAYNFLKQKQIKIITTDLKAKTKLNELKLKDDFCLVVGNEANGISQLSKQMSDTSIIIPLENNVESLNVAMALGITLYTLKTQSK